MTSTRCDTANTRGNAEMPDEPTPLISAAAARALALRERTAAKEQDKADTAKTKLARQSEFETAVSYLVREIRADIAKTITAVARVSARTPVGEIRDYAHGIVVDYSTVSQGRRGKTTAIIRSHQVRPGEDMDAFQAAWGVVHAEMVANGYEADRVRYTHNIAFEDTEEGFHPESYTAFITIAW